MPSLTPRCSSYWKGSFLVTFDLGHQLYFTYIYICTSYKEMEYIYIHIYAYIYIYMHTTVYIYIYIYMYKYIYEFIHIYIYIYIYGSPCGIMDFSLKVSSNSSHTMTFIFRLTLLGKIWTHFSLTSSGLDSITAVLQQGWI